MRTMTLMSAVLITGLVYASGCAPQASAPPAKVNTVKTEAHDHEEHASTDNKTEKQGGDHDHSGWWCAEHGVPEKQCSQCSSKVAAELQKKGDWCAEHDRAKSQCFICNPSLKETFAKQYRAKEGQEPPPLEEAEAKADKKS